MYSSEAHIKLWAPAQGYFHLMDVDTLSGAKRVSARFARTPSGDFELIEQSVTAGGPMFEEAAPGGPMAGGVGPEESTEAPIDLRKRIEAAQEKSLEEAVSKVASGCPADTREKLGSAVAQVLMSDVTAGAAQEPARYLRCLRNKGYETTANAIASRFFATNIPEGHAPASWSISCPKCDKSASSAVCSSAAPAKSGSYQAEGRDGRPEVSISSGAANPAGTFFHESLHAAGVTSEKEASDVARCCGQGAQGDCKDMTQAVAVRDRTQVYMSSYFNLPAGARQKVDKASRRIDKNTNGNQLAVRYLSKAADAHQMVFEANRGGRCKDETSETCQELLRDSEKKVFDKELASKCGKAPTAAGPCQKSVAEIAAVIGPRRGLGQLNLAAASRLIKEGLLPRGPSNYHQLPMAQMADAAARAGEATAQNLPMSAGAPKAIPYQGPRMATFDMLRNDKLDRAQIDMADVFSKQTGVVNAIVSRVAKIASSVLAAVPLHAAHVPDPSAVRGKRGETVGMSAHLKKVLTPKSPGAASAEVKSSNSSAPAAWRAEDKGRQDFIKQMTSADERRLNVDLGRKETLKTLNEYNIGVIDQNGARRDQTSKPTRWLIYDEESGRLQFLDADDAESVSK